MKRSSNRKMLKKRIVSFQKRPEKRSYKDSIPNGRKRRLRYTYCGRVFECRFTDFPFRHSESWFYDEVEGDYICCPFTLQIHAQNR